MRYGRRFPKEGKTIRTALGQERVIAVDIFRERVFLRSEDQGSRIITLVQLKEEVEGLGDVLVTAEYRARAAAAEAEPTETGQERSERRRRRRGRDSGGAPQG